MSVAVGAAALAQSSHGAATDPQTPLEMPVPNLAGATLVSHIPASTPMSVSISLQPLDREGLEEYVAEINGPRSPLYHRFLKPEEVGERFGASVNTVNATVAYLKAKGLTVTLSASSRMAVLATGKASNVENAFHTTINLYSSPKRVAGRKSFYCYTTVPQLPKSLATQTVAVGGLQTANLRQPASLITPQQARNLYNATAFYTGLGERGTGVNIGITNYDGYSLSDADKFIRNFNLLASTENPSITKVAIGGSNGELVAPGGEGDLDIQCILAIAPKANLFIYDASFNGDSIALFTRMSQDNRVDIVTESYGIDPNDSLAAGLIAEHDQHLVLSALGITYMAATGDEGAGLTKPDPNNPGVFGFGYPALDPQVLAIGGTVATVNANGNRVDETGWDGSGGGWKAYDLPFNRTPDYQKKSIVTIPKADTVDRRFYPDISLHALGSNARDGRDPRGDNGVPFVGAYYFYTSGQLLPYGGGTSAASPTFAGILGLILQDLKAKNALDPNEAGKYRLGLIQPVLYEQIGLDPMAIYDVLGGDIGLLPDGSTGKGIPGYDFVTGLGAPSATGLRDVFFNNSSVSLSDSPNSVGIYSTGTLLLGKDSTKTGFGTSGTPTTVPTLVATDAIYLTLESVTQKGVGQVAAITVDVTLNGDASTRRGSSLTVAMKFPSLAGGFVYLLNPATNKYDVLKTSTGSGSLTSTTITFDAQKYAPDGEAHLLLRAMRPARFGTAPFTLTVDKAIVIEKVPRTSP